MDFPSKNNGQTKRPESEEQKFLTQAKARHAELFGEYLTKAENYACVEEYTDAIEQES